MQAADSSAPMRARLLLSRVWPVLSCDSIPASSLLSELYTCVMCSFGRALSILGVNLGTWSLSKRLTLSALIESLPNCSALDFKRGLHSSANLLLFRPLPALVYQYRIKLQEPISCVAFQSRKRRCDVLLTDNRYWSIRRYIFLSLYANTSL